MVGGSCTTFPHTSELLRREEQIIQEKVHASNSLRVATDTPGVKDPIDFSHGSQLVFRGTSPICTTESLVELPANQIFVPLLVGDNESISEFQQVNFWTFGSRCSMNTPQNLLLAFGKYEERFKSSLEICFVESLLPLAPIANFTRAASKGPC